MRSAGTILSPSMSASWGGPTVERSETGYSSGWRANPRIGRQLSDPRPLRRTALLSRDLCRKLTAQHKSLLTRTLPAPDSHRKQSGLPAISSQPGLPHTASRMRPRTAINAPPRSSQSNISVQHEHAGGPAVRVALFMKDPVTAPATPMPSPGASTGQPHSKDHMQRLAWPGAPRTVLTEQQKWRFSGRTGTQTLMHEFPLLSDVLAFKAEGYQVRHLLKKGYDVSTLRQAGYSAQELKREVFPPPPSHILRLVHPKRSSTTASCCHHLLDCHNRTSSTHLLRHHSTASSLLPPGF